MPQVFRRRSNAIAKLTIIILVIAPIIVFLGFTYFKWSSFQTEVGVTIAQAVPFSHKHHVLELGIDCRFCHSFVEISAIAGMPTSTTCMTCHSQIWQGAPMLEPVRESYRLEKPIGYNQVNRLPKFVFFDHSIHIKKGIGCQSCHGQIEMMPLTQKTRTFFMRDCLSCHREPEKFLRPPEEIFNPNYQLPYDKALGEKLLKHYDIHKEHMTDCYTCHR